MTLFPAETRSETRRLSRGGRRLSPPGTPGTLSLPLLEIDPTDFGGTSNTEMDRAMLWLSGRLRANRKPGTTIETFDRARAVAALRIAYDYRAITPDHVEELAALYGTPSWIFNNAAVGFSASGHLVDGLHRLKAVVKTGIPLETVTVWGLRDDAVLTMDNGKPRTVYDLLHAKRYRACYLLAAAVRLIEGYKQGDLGIKLTPVETEKAAHAGGAILQEAVQIAQTAFGRRHEIITASTGAFFYDRAARLNPKAAEAFVQSLRYGMNLSQNDPILRLRSLLLRNRDVARDDPTRMDRYRIAASVVLCWNLKEGQGIRSIRSDKPLLWDPATPFPRFSGEKDGVQDRA